MRNCLISESIFLANCGEENVVLSYRSVRNRTYRKNIKSEASYDSERKRAKV